MLFDGEGAIAPLTTWFQSLGIKVNQASKNEHVADVERAGRQLKERVRGYWQTIPYQLTAVMIIYLVYYCVRMINIIPRTGMIGGGLFSPKELATGVKTDARLILKLAYGEYCQVHSANNVTNTMEARSVGMICMGPADDLQGNYDFYNLATGAINRRRQWVHLPIPKETIELINTRAASDRRSIKLSDAQFRLGMQIISDDILDDGQETQSNLQPTIANESLLESDTPDNNAGTHYIDPNSDAGDSSLTGAHNDHPVVSMETDHDMAVPEDPSPSYEHHDDIQKLSRMFLSQSVE
jgi:hypothetical protein